MTQMKKEQSWIKVMDFNPIKMSPHALIRLNYIENKRPALGAQLLRRRHLYNMHRMEV